MKNLKRSIVVVNEFTVPLPKRSSTGSARHAGSRGGTPGDYVLRYMARNNATESLAPIRRQRTDQFIEHYMARAEATEALDVDAVPTLKRRMKDAQGQGGVAFGYGQVSLSHDALKAASKDIQELFDGGHTVMKTVLSFDAEYLSRYGIVPKGFVVKRKGDYRGKLDQMKLRLAIMNGLDKMGRMLYDDLRYVAVIQVDTEHVHCHLAMVDAGAGTKAPDGTQRGKIGDRAKSLLRRGVDSWLDEKQSVKHLSSAVGYERRNVATFVKRWAHQQMLRESLPQFLLACLPADKRKWRYGTNAKEMQKPNRIVREIVEEALAQPGSPYPESMARIQRYANYRRKNEGLSQAEWQRLVDQGHERIVERGVNGVYALLRGLPADALRIKTPMLEVMGLDYEEIAARAASRQMSGRSSRQERQSQNQDDLIGFGFRLRSYSARLTHHQERREHYRSRAREWERADQAGAASADSSAMHSFFLEEEEYHARVASKYRSLLNFIPASTQWQPWVDEVTAYGEKLLSLEALRKDPSLRRMKDSQQAERLGRDIYGQSGGALLALGDKDSLAELDRRLAAMRQTYDRRVEDLRMKLASGGLRLQAAQSQSEGDGKIQFAVEAGPEHPFEQVKTLDLHHMKFDFSRDVEVGSRGRRSFVQWAQRRRRALDSAVAYLEGSGQSRVVAQLPVEDIRQMADLASEFQAGAVELPSEMRALAQRREAVRRSRTVTLGTKLQTQLRERIDLEAKEAAFELEGIPGEAQNQPRDAQSMVP